MSARSEKEPTFELSGGRLSLDFVNTLGDRTTPPTVERLASVGALLAFGQQSGALTADAVQELQRFARSHPMEAASALAEAQRLREVLFRIFQPLSQGRTAPPPELAALN